MHGPNGIESLRPIFFLAILTIATIVDKTRLISNVLYVQNEPDVIPIIPNNFTSPNPRAPLVTIETKASKTSECPKLI